MPSEKDNGFFRFEGWGGLLKPKDGDGIDGGTTLVLPENPEGE